MTPLVWTPRDLRAGAFLRAGEVHVWRVSLDETGAGPESRLRILSVDERLRAARFHFERDRDRFVAGRAALRELVGLYQGTPAERVEFRYGPLGKPALSGRGEDLRFNVSHSKGLALVAFSRDRELGVDVELMRPLDDADQLAGEFFSAREADALRRLPDPRRRRGFFECWTRKEAYLKATGGGLAAGLDRFAVSLGDAACLEWVDGRPDEPSHWWLSALDPHPAFAAAIAVEGAAEPRVTGYAMGPASAVKAPIARRLWLQPTDGLLR